MNFESLVGHINQVQDVLHEIVQTASAQLEEWCTPPEKLFYRLHFSNLSYIATIDDPLKRAFYEQEAIRGCWTYRELDRQVSSQYYERMGLSKDKKALQKLAVKNGQIDYWRQCPRQRTTKKGLFHELTIDIVLQTLSASEVQMTVQEHCFCLLGKLIFQTT